MALDVLREIKQLRESARAGAQTDHPTPPPANRTALAEQLRDATQAGTQQAAANGQTQLNLELEQLNEMYFVTQEGGRVRVMEEGHDPETDRPIITSLGTVDFKALYMNRTVTLAGPNGETRSVRIGDYWLNWPGRRQFLKGIVVLPNETAPAGYYNAWQGWGVVIAEGDAGPALEFIRLVVCSGDSTLYYYVVRWLAWTLQNPGKPAEVALVLQGLKGTGKGTLGRWLLDIFGAHGVHILHRRHLTGNFNAHLRMACFLFVDEAFFVGDREGANVLKGLITEAQIIIEKKGIDAVSIRNRLTMLIATNEKFAVPATEDERRFCMIEISADRRGDHAYFGALDRHMRGGGLAALAHHLLNLDLSDFNIRAVPNTGALEKQKILNLPPLKAWLFEKLWEGRIHPVDTGWTPEQQRETLVALFADYCREKGHRYTPATTQAVGEDLHMIFPALGKRRETGGRRAWRWVLPNLDAAREQFAAHCGLEFTRWPDAGD